MTLTEFLLARIAEDEAVARAAYSEGPWRSGTTYTALVSVEAAPWTVAANLARTDADHIARHDPTRVLAECEAKRRIVRGWGTLYERPPFGDENARQAGETAGHVFRCLALPYADHPDYRAEWKP